MGTGPTRQRVDASKLLEAIAAIREAHGEEPARCAIAAFTTCAEFIRMGGHGNLTLAVKAYRVAPVLKIEYFRNTEQGDVEHLP